MEYLHTMVRISDVEASLDFWCDKLGLKEIRRSESEQGRYTLIFLAAPGDEARARAAKAPMLELTYNWDPEELRRRPQLRPPRLRGRRHLRDLPAPAWTAASRSTARRATAAWRSSRSPDGISIELLQKGDALPKREPWASMANTGSW